MTAMSRQKRKHILCSKLDTRGEKSVIVKEAFGLPHYTDTHCLHTRPSQSNSTDIILEKGPIDKNSAFLLSL